MNDSGRFTDEASVTADIVLPFFNQQRLLCRCLRSVNDSGYNKGRIFIVNDCSEAGELLAIEKLCSELDLDTEIISHDTNRGYRESVLTGVRKSHSRYVILLNSDTVVTPFFADKLTGVMLKNPSIRAVAPVSNHPTDLYQFRKRLYIRDCLDDLDHQSVINLFNPLLKKRRFFLRWFSRGVTEVPYLSANCLAIDTKVFKEAGYFHGKYDHGYFEDLDLCCSIRDMGFKLAVNENCFVFHRGQGSYQSRPTHEKEKQIWKNYYIFESRWGHLPEHRDLVKKMHWAGREYPI